MYHYYSSVRSELLSLGHGEENKQHLHKLYAVCAGKLALPEAYNPDTSTVKAYTYVLHISCTCYLLDLLQVQWLSPSSKINFNKIFALFKTMAPTHSTLCMHTAPLWVFLKIFLMCFTSRIYSKSMGILF